GSCPRSAQDPERPLLLALLGEEKLDQLQVKEFDDYAKFLPSVSFQSTGPNATNVYFRGVASGGDGNHSASLPSVGVYLDEQPITTIFGMLPIQIYDIARVEAIAGPQGTLYGASAQSGVLRIITNKPNTEKFEAGIDLEGNKVAHGDFGYEFKGFINQPLGDKAALRVVAWYDKDAGYIDNVRGTKTFPTSGVTKTNAARVQDDFNEVETYGLRAALKVDLDEDWSVTPSIMAQRLHRTGTFFFDPDKGDLNISRFEDDVQTDKFVQAALLLEGKIGDFNLVYSGAYLKRGIDSSTDYTDYAYYYDRDFGYGTYFYSNAGPTAYIDPTQFYIGDDDYGKISQEIRISSPQENRLRFVAGLFYNRQSHYIGQRYIVRNLANILEVTGYPDTVWLTKQHRVDRDYAIFTEATFDITSRLTLTGGVRGYRYDNTLQGFFGYGPVFAANFGTTTGQLSCFASTVVVEGAPCINIDKGSKNTGLTYKGNLSWKVTDDKMVYFTHSTGFRPGGVNRRGTLPPYLEDKLVNYEAGFKTAWADNRFIVNAAFFWQKWKDFQFPILGQNGLTEIKNAAQARVRGIEADVTWAPTDRLTLNGAFSLINAELTENYCGYVVLGTQTPDTNCPKPVDNPATPRINETDPPQAPAGQRLPVVPGFKGTFTARYEWPMFGGDANVQGSVSGQNDSESDLLTFDRTILGRQEGYVVADFSIGFARDGLNVGFYVNNAFDTRADQFNFVACPIGVCGVGGGVYQGTNQPRTYGLRVGKKF
ncbi:MAG: TonB-dependent receptor, partial [Parvularculaceae bacterium]|nr:TonB-dependent receptor [Parvularculaceae bacterium]